MRAVVVRSAGTAVLIALAAVLLGFTSTMASVFTLVAITYVVPGTNFAPPFCVPFCGTLVTPQQNIDLATPYVNGTVNPPPGQTTSYVNYSRSFWPLSVGYLGATKYDDSVNQGVAALPSPATIGSGSVIFGYSEGANVATIYKRNFNQYYASNPSATPPQISFVLIGNGNRPNGGALERFNGLFIPIVEFTADGATPTTTAGAAPGQITTYDIAQQYDGFADFPTNPLNVLADANAAMGLVLVHPNYQNVNMSQAVFQGTYGDTAYYLIPTYPLPLLMPLEAIPVAGPVLIDTLDPVLRVLVEAGYNRTINPGQPTPANFFYFPNPANLATSVLVAIPTGLNLGLQDIMGTRTPGTPPPGLTGQGAYGIGGPPVTLPGQTPPPIPAAVTLASTSTPQSASPTNDASANTPPATTAAADDTPSTPAPTADTSATTPAKPPAFVPTGPKLNVCRPAPCQTFSPSGTTGSSPVGTGTGTPITSPINGVVSAVTGAVTNTVNAIGGALGQHPASSSTSKP